MDALGMAGNIRTTFMSMSREFAWDWMDETNQSKFDARWTIAEEMATNVSVTALADWLAGELTGRLELEEPSDWPRYRLNHSVSVETDGEVPRDGIYVSDIDGSCAKS